MSQTNTSTNNGQNRNQNSRSNHRNNCGNKTIAKYVIKGKMKDGLISKLLITDTEHRPTQYKKITDTLPVLCADKNFQGLDEVIWTRNDLVETDFMPTYPNTTQWSTFHHVQVSTINPTKDPDIVNSERPPILK